MGHRESEVLPKDKRRGGWKSMPFELIREQHQTTQNEVKNSSQINNFKRQCRAIN